LLNRILIIGIEKVNKNYVDESLYGSAKVFEGVSVRISGWNVALMRNFGK